jgi:hypothetical protein
MNIGDKVRLRDSSYNHGSSWIMDIGLKYGQTYIIEGMHDTYVKLVGITSNVYARRFEVAEFAESPVVNPEYNERDQTIALDFMFGSKS